MSSATTAAPRQWLVRFQDETLVTYSSCYDDILSYVSSQTQWPIDCLEVSPQSSYPFCAIRVVSSLRGGKGGFGTLLKGQGRQSGARQTTDFGACRDLQGRRLRHVNDEIKLRKWREAQQLIQEGKQDPNDTDYLTKTPSGIYNWHLMTPSWSDLSNKATHKMQRNLKRHFTQFQSEQEKKMAGRKEREDAYHRSIDDYVRQTNQAAQSLHVTDAVRVGLATKRKRQEDDEDTIVTDDEGAAEPNALITLSGDLVVQESKDGWKLQSQSDFGTMALVLEGAVDDNLPAILYYEVVFETTGVAQIGWADLQSFKPSTESGDGVGDDAFSYAIDVSRSLKFHASEEKFYNSNELLIAGSVLGCMYNMNEKTLSFSLNGKDLGIAFTLQYQLPLVPALSCNQGEILDLKLKEEQMRYFPLGAVAVYDFMKEADTKVVAPMESSSTVPNPALNNVEHAIIVPDEKLLNKGKPISIGEVAPLNLDSFKTAEQLMGLGMDRLKGALLAMQCKCGGTLEERAKRLLSLKGLERKDYPQKVRARHFVV